MSQSTDSSVDGTQLPSAGSKASASTQSEGDPSVVSELYNYTVDAEEKEAVWLSNSYPSPISLKLQGIQKTVKENGRMDAESLNFAIRKLGSENYKKHCVNTDFARYAIHEEGGYSSLETCIDDDFMNHHNNALDQDVNPDNRPNSEALYIPVFHDGHWSLYAFNMNDQKLTILDPRQNCQCHEVLDPRQGCKNHRNIRLKICNALEFVKVKFNIFKNRSNNFSCWRYEVAKGCGQNISCSNDDSGFLIFNYMRYWDGCQPINELRIPTELTEMRKYFLAYILSFKDNEAYQLPSAASELIKKLRAGPAWTRCKMDTRLFRALGEDKADKFNKLFGTSDTETTSAVPQKMPEELLRGVTCDGDGMLHIAVRFGALKVLKAIKEMFVPSDSDPRPKIVNKQERGPDETHVRIMDDSELTQALFADSLRARNNRGETCLHEAVRRGDTQFVKSLIMMDEKMDGKTRTPPLVQRVDYQGVSPLYLATTLRSGDIVGILTRDSTYYKPSFAGPGGKTALHAAVLSKGDAKVLTERLLEWSKTDDDLIGMGDKSGSTPLHLVASSEGGASIAELLLSRHGTIEMSWVQRLRLMICPCTTPGDANTVASPTHDDDDDTRGSCAAAMKKDSNGWFPIHVAAANGRLDVAKKLLEACPECMQSRNDSGQTFLHLAVEKKMERVVHHVCSQKSFAGILNLGDRDGNTALHLAVKSGNTRIFCSLMSNSSVVLSFANKEGHTPLDLAILSTEPGLQLLLNSRVLIKYHLMLSGSNHGTYRRDLLKDDKVRGKLDKDKLSESISKSAGLMAICAIFMLNISVAAFFNVAKQNLSADVAPPPPALPTTITDAKERSSVARGRAFRALILSDAITFASSSLAAFCSIFAGFSIMDRPTRLVYLRVAGFSLRISCLAVVAVFVLAAYLAFAPIDPHMATAACVLSLVAVTPQLFTPFFILLFHMQAILSRLFQKHVPPKLCLASQVISGFFEKHVSPIVQDIIGKLPTSFSYIIKALAERLKCFCLASFTVCLAPVLISIGAIALVILAVCLVLGVIAAIVVGIVHLVTD